MSYRGFFRKIPKLIIFSTFFGLLKARTLAVSWPLLEATLYRHLTNFKLSQRFQIWYGASMQWSLTVPVENFWGFNFFRSIFDVWNPGLSQIFTNKQPPLSVRQTFDQLLVIVGSPNLVHSFFAMFYRGVFWKIPKFIIFSTFFGFLKSRT